MCNLHNWFRRDGRPRALEMKSLKLEGFKTIIDNNWHSWYRTFHSKSWQWQGTSKAQVVWPLTFDVCKRIALCSLFLVGHLAWTERWWSCAYTHIPWSISAWPGPAAEASSKDASRDADVRQPPPLCTLRVGWGRRLQSTERSDESSGYYWLRPGVFRNWWRQHNEGGGGDCSTSKQNRLAQALWTLQRSQCVCVVCVCV